MTIAPLSPDEIRARLAEYEEPEPEEPEAPAGEFRYIRPFEGTYESILAALENPDDRIMLGLTPIDSLTRGFGPKELVFISGFAHSGKTQLVNTMILNNRSKRILFFSMDDPAEMILLKLTCMAEGYSADVLEQRIREGDLDAKQALKRSACERFPNLLVIDESLGMGAMTKAVKEATDYWQGGPDLIIIDYLELVQGSSSDDDASANVKHKSQALKRWVKDMPCPVMVVHQATRSKGAPGEPVTMLSMAYGGEQEATIVIGVRRKRDNERLDSFERDYEKNTVTLHVAKNKRPPARVTPQEGVDFYLDPDTGLIRTLRDGDRPRPSQTGTPSADPLRTAEQALAVARERAAAVGVTDAE